MLDQSFRDRAIRKQRGVKLVTAILKNWSHLDSWWKTDSSSERKMAVLTLLAKVLQVNLIKMYWLFNEDVLAISGSDDASERAHDPP